MKQRTLIMSHDTIGAIFIIAVLSLLTVSMYFLGFILPLYVLAMGIAVLIAISNPKSALYAAVVLTMIFERFFALVPVVFGRAEYKLYPIDVLMGALFLGIALQFLRGRLRVQWKRVDMIGFGFLALAALYCGASILTAGTDSALAISTAKNYTFYGALYFATILLMQRKDDAWRLGAFVLGGAAAIIGFIAYGIFSGTGLWSEYTPLSTEGVRTLAFTHALYVSIALIIGVVLAVREAFEKITPILAALPVWAIGIVGSMMRHLWIALSGALLLVYALLSHVQKKRIHAQLRIYVFLGLALVIVVLYGASLLPYSPLTQDISSATAVVQHRVTSIADSGDESILWRGAVWKESVRALMDSPIFGIGYGKRISIEIGKYHDFVDLRNIHNSYLVLLVQMGLVGALVFGTWVLMLLYGAWKHVRAGYESARIASLGIAMLFLVAMAFQPYLETNILSIFFWITLGMLRVSTNFESYENSRN